MQQKEAASVSSLTLCMAYTCTFKLSLNTFTQIKLLFNVNRTSKIWPLISFVQFNFRHKSTSYMLLCRIILKSLIILSMLSIHSFFVLPFIYFFIYSFSQSFIHSVRHSVTYNMHEWVELSLQQNNGMNKSSQKGPQGLSCFSWNQKLCFAGRT